MGDIANFLGNAPTVFAVKSVRGEFALDPAGEVSSVFFVANVP